MKKQIKAIALAVAIATSLGSVGVASAAPATTGPQAIAAASDIVTVASGERNRFRRHRGFRRHRFFRRHRHGRRHFRHHRRFRFGYGDCGMRRVWSDYYGRHMWVRNDWCY